MRLRSTLFLLVGAAVLPLVAVTAVLGTLLVEQIQDTYRDGALHRNRAFMSAVDAELRGYLATLQAAATSKAWREGDLPTFRDELRVIRASQNGWRDLFLSDSAVSPLDGDPASLAIALRGTPVVGNVARWPSDAGWGIAVRLPLSSADGHAKVLTAVIDPGSFQPLIVAQNLPAGWRSGLADAHGHFIARVPPRPGRR